ncbi:MAG: hypothetical protein IT353_06930 [Gemmatimonadaceae bacterium]|nr:hypothetical protein [Gemmatimonadaceae bacterium]
MRADVVGCFRLLEADGGALDSATAYHAFSRVRLRSDLTNDTLSRVGRWRYVTRSELGEVLPYYELGGPSWNADSLTDTIRISFSDGFSGALLALSAPVGGGDTLHGAVAEYWDYGDGSPTNRRGVRAEREACPRARP